MHIFITAPSKVHALYQCTQLIVGDQYSDLDTMNFLGAKLVVGGGAEAPPMWMLRATPRAVMDALQERGFELKLAHNIESQTTWIMSKPEKVEKPDERKSGGSAPPLHDDRWSNIKSEDSMHSMPRGPRRVPTKTKPQSKEGVEMAVTVVGAESPSTHDEKHPHSRHHAKGEKKQLYDEYGNPVRGSAESMAPAENEDETYSARPTSRKTGKSKSRPDTPATYNAKDHPSKHSDSSDEEEFKILHDDPALTVKKRKFPAKEKKSSPKKGSKKSIEE